MAKRINQDLCIQCNACREECLNGGIFEIDAVYMIDPRLCEECSGFSGMSRCEEVCPVNAIETDTWDWGPVMTTRIRETRTGVAIAPESPTEADPPEPEPVLQTA